MRIWKYELEVTDEQYVDMAPVRGFLSLQVQGWKPCLWVHVDDEAPYTEQYRIRIIGTGNPMPDNPGFHIGTFQLGGGALVFHAFAEFVKQVGQ